MNKAAIYICHKFVCGYMFKYLGVELLNFMISICGALEETESSEVICTIMHSDQQWIKKVSVVPYPCQCLVLLLVFIIVTSVDM